MTPHLSVRRAFATALVFGVMSASPVAAQTPGFDGRGWTIGNRQENATEILTEYVLPGQTVETWRELVTSTVFHQAVPLDAFVNRLRSSLGEGCPSLVWNLIQQDQRTAIYEFRDAGCGGFEATSEIDRVTIESDKRMYRLAYAAKRNGPLAPARRKEWLDILTQIPPAEGLVSGSAAALTSPAAPDETAKTRGKTLSTEELAAGVQKLAWPCPKGVKSEVKGQTNSPMACSRCTTWNARTVSGSACSWILPVQSSRPFPRNDLLIAPDTQKSSKGGRRTPAAWSREIRRARGPRECDRAGSWRFRTR